MAVGAAKASSMYSVQSLGALGRGEQITPSSWCEDLASIKIPQTEGENSEENDTADSASVLEGEGPF